MRFNIISVAISCDFSTPNICCCRSSRALSIVLVSSFFTTARAAQATNGESASMLMIDVRPQCLQSETRRFQVCLYAKTLPYGTAGLYRKKRKRRHHSNAEERRMKKRSRCPHYTNKRKWSETVRTAIIIFPEEENSRELNLTACLPGACMLDLCYSVLATSPHAADPAVCRLPSGAIFAELQRDSLLLFPKPIERRTSTTDVRDD